MKLSNLTEEGILALASGVLGFVALLVMFGCSTSSTMGCDSLIGPEKEECLERIRNINSNFRYQMETSGNVR